MVSRPRDDTDAFAQRQKKMGRTNVVVALEFGPNCEVQGVARGIYLQQAPLAPTTRSLSVELIHAHLLVGGGGGHIDWENCLFWLMSS